MAAHNHHKSSESLTKTWPNTSKWQIKLKQVRDYRKRKKKIGIKAAIWSTFVRINKREIYHLHLIIKMYIKLARSKILRCVCFDVSKSVVYFWMFSSCFINLLPLSWTSWTSWAVEDFKLTVCVLASNARGWVFAWDQEIWPFLQYICKQIKFKEWIQYMLKMITTVLEPKVFKASLFQIWSHQVSFLEIIKLG